ncbi:MAG: hypothetical protein GXY05_00150, partial [Clostridiales bacterium]|nr:hypothetical protein [Clostridiales bacterium]
RCDYDLITSDKQRKVYDVLTARYINGSFDYKHQMAMTILAKFGYTDMITEAGKFIVREQYSDALEALKYFPDKPQATELITAIARQSKDPVAAFEAERLLKKL